MRAISTRGNIQVTLREESPLPLNRTLFFFCFLLDPPALVFMRRPFSGLALFRAVEALHAATALLEPLHGCAAAHAGLAVGGGGKGGGSGG